MNPSPPKKAKATLTPGFQKSGLQSQLIHKLITTSVSPVKSCSMPFVATFVENRPRAFWEGFSAKAAITNNPIAHSARDPHSRPSRYVSA